MTEFTVDFTFSVLYNTDDFPDCTTQDDCFHKIYERAYENWPINLLREFEEHLPIVGSQLSPNQQSPLTDYAFLAGNMGEPGEIHLRGRWWPEIEEDQEGLHPFVIQTCEGEEFIGSPFLVRKHQIHHYNEEKEDQ